MKRWFSLLLLLALILTASVAFAASDTVGRVYGYMDKIKHPGNMFAPHVIFTDVPHVEDRYAEFAYIKEGTYERHWQINIVDGAGRSRPSEGTYVRVIPPYPSIWSKAQQLYWKWTQRYADKHYSWEYALGYSRDITDKEGNYVTIYERDEYRPVKEMLEFGPCIDIQTGIFKSGLTIWVRFE
ncbi:MAG: hypothetical protein J6K55_02715 [Clostridia bacterium]|nr:hypothetical protein [Clostridia bacterium]